MRRDTNWLPAALLAVVALAVPTLAQADLVCPGCDAGAMVTLGVGEVVELVLETVLRRGVALLLLGATAIVSLPWLVAGVAVAVFYIPRWLKA